MSLLPSKALRREVAADGKWLFGFVLRALHLNETQAAQGKLIDRQAAEIDALREAVRTGSRSPVEVADQGRQIGHLIGAGAVHHEIRLLR